MADRSGVPLTRIGRLIFLRAASGIAGFAGVWASLRVLSPEQYGAWSAMLALAIAWGAATLGWVGQATVRFGLLKADLTELVRSSYGQGSTVLLVVGAVTIGAVNPPGTSAASAALAVVLIALGAGLATVSVSTLQSRSLEDVAGAVDLIRSTVYGLLFATLVALNLTLGGAAVAVGACMTIAGGLILRAALSLRESVAVVHPVTPSQRFQYGGPLGAWVLLSAVYQVSDRVVISRMANSTEAGLYAGSYDVVSRPINLVLTAFLAVLNARYFAQLREGANSEATRTDRVGVVLVACLGGLGGFASVALSLNFYSELGLREKPSPALLGPIAAAAVIWAVAGSRQRPVQAADKTQSLLSAIALWVVVNIVTNIAFVPAYGSEAAAWTTLLSSGGYMVSVEILRSRSTPATTTSVSSTPTTN